MATTGVLLGLIILIALAMRGVNVVVAALLGALVVAVTNAQPLVEALMEGFTGSMMGFAGQFFLIFLAGAIFGRVMGETQAAASVAFALSKRLGAERVLYICTIACVVLTYGGVNVFIVIFTVYPLGLSLLQQADLPKRLLLGAVMLGAGTFTMTALPGTPSLQNVISAQALGTSLTSGPVIGLIVSALTFGLGMWYLESERRRARRRGETFKPAKTDVLPDKEPDARRMPHWSVSLIPLAAVLLTIMGPLWISGIVYGGDNEDLPALLAFSQAEPMLWTSFAMVVGTLLAILLFWPFVNQPWGIVSRGAENSVLPLLNTAAVIGFGGVVQATEAFQWFAELMVGSGLHPLVSAVLSINIVAGIVGSASGGLGIFMETLAPYYLEQGVHADTLHRIVTIGSGGLDSLPHSGAVITTLTVMGLTHREAYKDGFIVTVLVPLASLVLLLTAGLVLGIW